MAGRGRQVILLEQEPEVSLGGQAFWSFGGLFLVDSPEQRRMGIRDSHDLAWQDWLGSAGFGRPEDAWPRRWAAFMRRGADFVVGSSLPALFLDPAAGPLIAVRLHILTRKSLGGLHTDLNARVLNAAG